jgi:hypothetical protein
MSAMLRRPVLARIPLLFGTVMCLTRAVTCDAQMVLLQIRPRVGDTLHLRLEQQTELTGSRRGDGAPSVASITTSLRVYSRAIIERSAPAGTFVRAITDSVRLTGTDEAITDEARRALEGRAMMLRIAPDGTVALVDANGDDFSGASDAVSLIPAAFPKGAIAVGYTWSRDMPLPGGGRLAPGAGPVAGWLHTKFRLDSVTHGGTLAYVSMHGEMSADPDAHLQDAVGPLLEKGSVYGTMLVDRARGWLTESQFTIIAHSVVKMRGTADSIMRFETRVTQRMKAIERR